MQSLGRDNNPPILKALSGLQSGVEIALADGEYTLGSGRDDDLQFVDLCLKSGHARIRIDGTRIFVAGGAGSIATQAGLLIDAGDEAWRELELLDVLTIGANAFAIGPASANWSELLIPAGRQEGELRAGRKGRFNIKWGMGWRKYRVFDAGAAVFVLILVWLSAGFFFGLDSGHGALTREPDLQTLREALDRFEFGKSIELRQEVDGTIYAAGYVKTPVERRALHDAFENLGAEVNWRLGVLSSIRTQVSAAIDSFGVDVTFDLSEQGEIVLDGDILSNKEADRFLDYVQTEVSGLSSIKSNIRTASFYFGEVEKLAQRSDIGGSVLLRLSEERIEASGVVVTDKVDGWIGFIQSYAKRFAERIPLTSYVQLVNDRGQVVADSVPTRLAGPALPDEKGVVNLDLFRLRQGMLNPSDLFGGVSSQSEKTAGAADDAVLTEPQDQLADAAGGSSPEEQSAADKKLGISEAELEQRLDDDIADRVLKRWDQQASDNSEGLSQGGSTSETVRQRYLPLIRNPVASADRCWENSRLRVSDLPEVLFWLEYLGLSDKLSLIGFDKDRQYLLLEAAINPDRTRQCAERFKQESGIGFGAMPLLDDIDRTPFFIRYLVRDFVPPALEVAGVMLGERERYLQTPEGAKLQEGGSPSPESRLMSVGALGALLRQGDDVSPLLYPERLVWKMTAN